MERLPFDIGGQSQDSLRSFALDIMPAFSDAPYGGASFRMMGSRTDPAGVVVTSQILRSEAPSIEVDWRLGVIDRRYKITDVAVDGESVALSQRAAFASIIERNGGQVAVLLATMRE